MSTLAKRGSGTPVTSNTTWTNTANAVDGAPGSNPATYTVWTNTTANAVGYIEVSGYDFSSLAVDDTLNSVTVSVRSLVSNASRISALTVQPYVGATPIGTPFTCTRTTSASTDTTTFPVTKAQLQNAAFKVRVTATRFNGTQAGTFSLDYIDVTADYSPAITPGFLMVWTGSAWKNCPMKAWSGSAWVQKPVKRWTGSVWELA